MAFPGVIINVSNGNLLQEIAVLDSVPCLAATAKLSGNIHALKSVYSLQDAEVKGITEAAEPFLYGLIKEYYNELGGKQLLYIYGTAETETMADVVSASNADGLSAVMRLSNGAVNLIAIARKPSSGYAAGTAFLDEDVAFAVMTSKTFAQAMQKQNTPVRILIEGRVANKDKDISTYSPKTATNGYAAVVLGGTSPDGSAAVALALARASKFPAHVKIGSGQNGALSALQVYIGSDTMETRTDMETLHDMGFLTFHHRPGAAGYFFGRDNMCSVDDYRILVHGRIIDKAQRIGAAAFLPFIEDFVRLEANGTIEDTAAAYIENVLDAALRANEGEQFSDCKVVVDRTAQIVNTSTLPVSVKILPLGYLTWIEVTLGLTAEIVQS
jgi:hypothetical protein